MSKKYSCSAVVCDIEGTTTSIDFVKNVLFPYSYENVKEYLKSNWNDAKIQEIIKEIINLRSHDEKYSNAPEIHDNNNESLIESITNIIRHFIDKDYKIGPLKCLQGLIWEQGFKDGKFKGHVYDDVPKQFHKWHNELNIRIYIYSSGSVKAQKLLFQYSDHGDLLKYIDGHFDTAIGYKQDKQSYLNILKEINLNGGDVIFLTDIPNEAYAAKDAGIISILLDRNNQNNALTEKDRQIFPIIETFNQIELSLLS